MNDGYGTVAPGGLTAMGLLGVALVVLKLTAVVDWSWWWVTAPFWGPTALFIAGFVVYVLVLMVRDLAGAGGDHA